MAEDQVIFSQSMESQEINQPAIDKSVLYVTDLNNGSYGSGQILLDTSSLSNSGRWCDYSNAYFAVPLVAALYPSAAVTNFDENKNLNMSVGLKNGTIQLIHSMSVELNNASVIQLTPYTNFWLNFKLLTSLSQDDLNRGTAGTFWPDTADSWTFNTAASPDGIGSCNNRTFGLHTIYPSNGGRIYTAANIGAGASPVTISANGEGTPIDSLYSLNWPSFDGTIQSTGNFGLYQRTKTWGYNTDSTIYTNLLSKASCKLLYKDYFESETTNHAKVWRMVCHIKLRHTSDLFEQIGLSRGLYWRFILNTNVGTCALTSALVAGVPGVTGAGGYTGAYGSPAYTTYTLASAPTLTNATFPLMFASAAPGQPNYFLDRVGSKTWYVGCGISRYTQVAGGASYNTPATFSHELSTVRLYVPTYVLSAQAEAAYLEMTGGQKTIIYEDILQYNIRGVVGGQSVNQLITNGVVHPTRILVVPIFSAAASGGNATALASPIQSPFASEPGTTSPLTALTNLNVLLSGQSIFMLSEQYTFQSFYDELSKTGLNAGCTDGLASGLIDFQSWQNMYQYYLINVERRVGGGESVVPKSIQLLFTNLSEKTCDYYVFVGCRRSISISLANGTLLA